MMARHGRNGSLVVLLEGFEPVLGAPPGRVRRVYRNNPQPRLVGHRGQPVPDEGMAAPWGSIRVERRPCGTTNSSTPGTGPAASPLPRLRSEEHTSELQSRQYL